MALSNDLISQFVKAVSNDTEKPSETVSYGTIKVDGGTTYVQLDGSTMYTPVTSTTLVSDGDRVTVMIKDHSAVVTGNITAPSANQGTVDTAKEEVNSRINEFSIIVADKVGTEQLEAATARIKTLETNSLTAESVVITELEAANATITGTLNAHASKFDNVDASFVTVNNTLTAVDAKIGTLEATDADFRTLEADYGDFKTLTAGNFEAANAEIETLKADKLEASDLTAINADIENLKTDKLDASELTAVNANITNLQADVADIDTLIFGSASGGTIHSSFSNAVIAQLGDAVIQSAMIDTVAADKITAGTINTNNVNVQSDDGKLLIADETIQISDATRVRVQIGKDASGDYSINIWDTEGKLMFSEGGLTSDAIKDSIIRDDMVSDTANISASKLNIDSLFTEINGSKKTINSTKVYFDEEKQTLDLAFKSMTTDLEGLSDDVKTQGTQISVIQGQIDTKVWEQDIQTSVDSATTELTTNYSNLKQTVDGIATTVSGHTTTLSDLDSKASEAADKAQEAFANAVSAQSAANDAAQAAADAASRVATAEGDLADAKNNLADVVGRVGATEEEIAAAQEAVETAQAAADKAKEDAAAAQSTADTAQGSANAAQKAAEDAQSEVDALATRVTTAETNISQTRDQIALRATKTELDAVDGKFGNYYTKTQTDSAIKVKADSITSTVKQDILDIEVGSRNLIRHTDFGDESKRHERPAGGNTSDGFDFDLTCPIEPGANYTIGLDVRGNVRLMLCELFDERVESQLLAEVNDTENYIRVSLTKPASGDDELRRIAIRTQSGEDNTPVGSWFEIAPCSLKLERGDKATDWAPAPEDITSDSDDLARRIASAETTIKQLADSITMLVRKGESGTALKQDANGLYYFDISDIEKSIADTASNLGDLSGIVYDDQGKIDVLRSTAAALQTRTEYVRSYTDENDNPCLELGEGDSRYKVFITNTGVRLEDGTEAPAILSNRVLMIEKSVVRNELQFGDEDLVSGVWVWKRRANGNLGLSWKGGAS